MRDALLPRQTPHVIRLPRLLPHHVLAASQVWCRGEEQARRNLEEEVGISEGKAGGKAQGGAQPLSWGSLVPVTVSIGASEFWESNPRFDLDLIS